MYCLLILTVVCAVCCKNAGHNQPVNTNPIANTEIGSKDCASVGLNGKWKLVNIKDEGKNSAPAANETVIFKDCSKAEYYSVGNLTHTDLFKLYKVIQYCADYQLVYNHDSISCINFRKDTLIIGTCNDFETTKYIYKRM